MIILCSSTTSINKFHCFVGVLRPKTRYKFSYFILDRLQDTGLRLTLTLPDSQSLTIPL